VCAYILPPLLSLSLLFLSLLLLPLFLALTLAVVAAFALFHYCAFRVFCCDQGRFPRCVLFHVYLRDLSASEWSLV
jgi:hypothetical protein